MNHSMFRSVVFGLAMALVSMPLYAQSSGDENDDTVAKVETDGGVIMISDPGEFATALPDQRVHKKARLMVSEESSATVVYDDGCKQKYDDPGIYEISATCVLPIVMGGGPSKALIIGGIIVGSAAIYAIVDNNGDDDRPPVSR